MCQAVLQRRRRVFFWLQMIESLRLDSGKPVTAYAISTQVEIVPTLDIWFDTLGLNINIQSRSEMLRWNLGNPTKNRTKKIGVSALPTLYANGDLKMSVCAVGLF